MLHFTSPVFRVGFGRVRLALTVLISGLSLVVAGQAVEAKQNFDISAGDARPMLKQFAAQSKQEIVFPVEAVDGIRTNAVKGEMTAQAALEKMLENTGLIAFRDEASGAFAVRKETANEAKNAVSRRADDAAAKWSTENGILKLDTFEVMGSKLLNMDIPRSRDDAQPYVIFERAKIEESGAANLEDFLKQRLTMNTMSLTNNLLNTASGSNSAVVLRGFGASQTLILVDGHRVADRNQQGFPAQADLNGIPLAAVERIEILPTTASGIYGGNATGGVINIVLRRDYAGAELKLTYDNSFSTDSAIRRIDLSAGFTLEHGKTNVLLAASYSDANQLLVGDRNFVQRGVLAQFANNPASLLPPNAPPLGATPNIRSLTGANLVLQNGTPLNSAFTFVPAGYAGTASDGGAALVANAGRYNFALADTAQTTGREAGLTNGPTVESLIATVRRQFTPRLQAFVEVAASNNTGHFATNNLATTFTIPTAAPNNPFQQAIQVAVPLAGGNGEIVVKNTDRRIVGGVLASLPHDWKGEADFLWNQTGYSFVNAPGLATAGATAFANGTVDLLRDTKAFPVDVAPYLAPVTGIFSPLRSITKDTTLRLAGPVALLPAGTAVLSGFLEHRDQSFEEGAQAFSSFTFFFPSRSQAVNSAYLELRVPLVSPQNNLTGVKNLELQLAGRWDGYKVNGVTGALFNPTPATPITRSTTKVNSMNPTVGLRYEATPDLIFRVSYGTGFLPPNVNQVLPNFSGFNVTVADPRRGNTTTVLPAGAVLQNGNPNARPENSESWSAGLVLTPRPLPGLRLSVDYTRITKTDIISSLSAQQIVDNEALLGGRVTRGANLPGDLPGWAGPITFLDDTLLNISRARVEAYDVALDYRRPTGIGTFDVFAAATWQTHFITQLIASAPAVENVGVSSINPLKLKANAGITWTRGQWKLGWSARFFDSYLVSSTPSIILNQGGNGVVPSQTYHDVFASYRFLRLGDRSGFGTMLSGIELQAGVRNVFNTEPPRDARLGGFIGLYYSTYADPRLASYYISVRKQF